MSGLDHIRFIEDIELKDKRTFIRLDLNVPLKNGSIQDETRIQGALPTLKYALDRGAKIIVASHLGRPKGEVNQEYSLEPVATKIGELLDVEVQLVDHPASEAPKALLPNLRDKQILFLENLRFDPGEEGNSIELAKIWSEYTNVYINDAFGASHRIHSSIVALPSLVNEKAMGFLVKKEIEMLDQILFSSKNPFVAILGGSKVSDKIGLIDNLIEKIDTFIIGGAMAYTFLAAKNIPIGSSKVEKDKINLALDLLKRIEARDKKILLPVDHVIAQSINGSAVTQITAGAGINEGWMGADIGPKTTEEYVNEINHAETILWNGPVGVFEMIPFANGSNKIAEALASSSGITVVGGGDTASAVNRSGFSSQMTHISTGGGASLEYLQGDKLPGLEALKERNK